MSKNPLASVAKKVVDTGKQVLGAGAAAAGGVVGKVTGSGRGEKIREVSQETTDKIAAASDEVSAKAQKAAAATAKKAGDVAAVASAKVQKAADATAVKAKDTSAAAQSAAKSAASKAKTANKKIAKVTKDQDSRPYEERTKAELYERAQELDLDGRSGMTKDDLIAALRETH